MNLLEINLYLFWGSKARFGTLWQWNCYFLVSGRRENVQFHYNKWLSRWKARVGSFRTKSLGLGQKWNLWSDLQWFPHWTHLFGAFGRFWSRRNWGKVNGAELSEIKFFKISGDLFKRTGWVVGDLRRRIMEEDKFESSFAFWWRFSIELHWVFRFLRYDLRRERWSLRSFLVCMTHVFDHNVAGKLAEKVQKNSSLGDEAMGSESTLALQTGQSPRGWMGAFNSRAIL